MPNTVAYQSYKRVKKWLQESRLVIRLVSKCVDFAVSLRCYWELQQIHYAY